MKLPPATLCSLFALLQPPTNLIEDRQRLKELLQLQTKFDNLLVTPKWFVKHLRFVGWATLDRFLYSPVELARTKRLSSPTKAMLGWLVVLSVEDIEPATLAMLGRLFVSPVEVPKLVFQLSAFDLAD